MESPTARQPGVLAGESEGHQRLAETSGVTAAGFWHTKMPPSDSIDIPTMSMALMSHHSAVGGLSNCDDDPAS